jgi:hypothetical protein
MTTSETQLDFAQQLVQEPIEDEDLSRAVTLFFATLAESPLW